MSHPENSMALEFGFIPGFAQALQSSPAALEARAKLLNTIAGGRFTPRLRSIVALVVTQESRSDYASWAQTCVARRAGLSGEDMVFAGAATALDGREAAIARLAHIIARTGCFDPDEIRRLSRDPRLLPSDVLEIVANSALAVLDNYLIQGLAPAKMPAA
jgi:alkylhydroperoxidase family enzyme